MANRSHKNSERRSGNTIFSVLLTLLLWVVTLLSAAALVVTLIAPYFAPTHSWIFPLFGLIAPGIYLFNIVLLLFLIITWRWRAALFVGSILLLGIGRVGLFVQMPIEKDYGLNKHRGELLLLSYNVRGFSNDTRQPAVKQIVAYVNKRQPDIICFQECQYFGKQFTEELKKSKRRYYTAKYGYQTIYSRYPIIRSGNLFSKVDSIGGRSLFADIVVKSDTIRVFNNHLRTNSIRDYDKAYLNSTDVIRDEQRTARVGGIIKKYGHGSSERTAQVRVIRKAMKSSPYRYVVCGDFNDTPISYAYYELSRGMKDAFEECGDGYCYTFRGFNKLLRIDYILTSEGLTPTSYFTDMNALMSDHLPISAHLKID